MIPYSQQTPPPVIMNPQQQQPLSSHAIPQNYLSSPVGASIPIPVMVPNHNNKSSTNSTVTTPYGSNSPSKGFNSLARPVPTVPTHSKPTTTTPQQQQHQQQQPNTHQLQSVKLPTPTKTTFTHSKELETLHELREKFALKVTQFLDGFLSSQPAEQDKLANVSRHLSANEHYLVATLAQTEHVNVSVTS